MTTQLKNFVRGKKDSATEIAGTLIREYKQKRWLFNSQRLGKPDSLSAWFSMEEMENFIIQARVYGGDGMRFYYGAYPEDYEQRPEYAGRQTLVMVGTRSRISEQGLATNKDIYFREGREIKILCSNLPKGCPPICPPNNEGGMADLGITLIDKGKDGMEII